MAHSFLGSTRTRRTRQRKCSCMRRNEIGEAISSNRQTNIQKRFYQNHYLILSVYSDVIKIKGATPYDAAPSVEQFERERPNLLLFGIYRSSHFRARHISEVCSYRVKFCIYFLSCSCIIRCYLNPTLIFDEHTTDKVTIFVGSLPLIPFEYTYEI